jgi:transposase InsO family protein
MTKFHHVFVRSVACRSTRAISTDGHEFDRGDRIKSGPGGRRRRRVRRLMRKLGLWAVRPKPNTSKRHPERKVYPYLLRGKTIDRASQSLPSRRRGCGPADITYIPMRQGFLYLVAIIDRATRRVLSWRLSNTLAGRVCVAALSEALARFGKPDIFNQPALAKAGARNSPAVSSPRRCGIAGSRSAWTGAGAARQHLRRALVVDREAPMGLSAPSGQRHRTEAQSGRILRLV